MNSLFPKWLEVPSFLDSAFVIKNIEIDNFDDCFINITGLGFYELFINDKRVDNSFYKPSVSDYLYRDLTKLKDNIQEKTTHRIYYSFYNLKEFIHVGVNEIKVLLGNGFFCQKRRMPGGDDFHYGDNLLTSFEMHIIYKNKEKIIKPDGNEIIKKSFITSNNLFYGEEQDFSLLDDKQIFKGRLIELNSELTLDKSAKDIVSRTIKPILIYKSKDRYVYDLKENLSAFLSFNNFEGDIDITFAEEINNDFSLNYESSGDPYNEGLQIHHNIYKNVKKNMTCFPYFSFTCFRYFETNKELTFVMANIVHSDVKVIGKVKTNNELFDWYYDAFIRTMLNNMHYSFPSDCPHRERLGYTGDGSASSLISMMLIDSRAFYKKWIQDIMDSQDIETGHIQHTAPFMGGGGGPSVWGGAIIEVPYNYYLVYKDLSILEKTYQSMLSYIECMKGFLVDDLIVKERNWGWCLGDWCAPKKITIDPKFVNSIYFVYLLRKFKNICVLLGKIYEYQELEISIKNAVNAHFLDPITMNYCNNENSANAYALLIGLGNEKTLENLQNQFKKDIHLTTGFIGTRILTEVLAKYDRELLLKIFSCDSFPSFGYIKKAFKATTWYEGFAFDGSHCHHFQAGFLSYFLEALLGNNLEKKTMIKDGSARFIFNGLIYSIVVDNYCLNIKTLPLE